MPAYTKDSRRASACIPGPRTHTPDPNQSVDFLRSSRSSTSRRLRTQSVTTINIPLEASCYKSQQSHAQNWGAL